MKRVHVARHAPEAHVVRGYLAAHGIAAVVRGELLSGGWGELPVDSCGVWIENEADAEQAATLVRAFFAGEAARQHAHEAWTCAGCAERLEGQFTACWQCGRPR